MSIPILSRSTIRNVVASTRLGSLMSGKRLSSTRYYSSTMHDNDPEVLEVEKKRNLTGKQYKTSAPHDHAPGWNEYLATVSEASIKADRSNGKPADLQKQTIEYIHSHYTAEDSLEPTEALDTHDVVHGPLSDATGKEDNQDNNETVLTRKTIHEETTEILKDTSRTPSEENIKADRGEI